MTATSSPSITKLSVNLNKVALVRNARGGGVPNLVEAARLVLAAGCHGLTLHPREDERHATLDDVRALAALDAVTSGAVELNVEGDPRPSLMDVVDEVEPDQFTVVPVDPGEITTTRGWKDPAHAGLLESVVRRFEGRVRISLFVDPEPEGVRLASRVGAGAVELHTYEYAHHHGGPDGASWLERYGETADLARELGLRVNAGHDLDLDNLGPFLERVRPDEVSIGHALISEAIFRGLGGVTTDYLRIAAPAD